MAAAVAQPVGKVARELASDSAENEEDADGQDEASDIMREAACGEDADDVGEEERNDRARRE